MNIQNTILGLLHTQPMTGYELKQAFDSSLGFFSGASFGSIYPILNSCRKKGLVNMEVEVQDGKPNRKIYSLTPEGRKSFMNALSDELLMSPYKNEFLTRLFFFGFLDHGDRQRIVEEYLSYIDGKLEALEALEPCVKEHMDEYQAMCYRFGIKHINSTRTIIRQFLKEIGAKEGLSSHEGKTRLHVRP